MPPPNESAEQQAASAGREFAVGVRGLIAVASLFLAAGGGAGSVLSSGMTSAERRVAEKENSKERAAQMAKYELIVYQLAELTKKVDSIADGTKDRFTLTQFAEWRTRHDREHEKLDTAVRDHHKDPDAHSDTAQNTRRLDRLERLVEALKKEQK